MNLENAALCFIGAIVGGTVGSFAAICYLGYCTRRLENAKLKAAILQMANTAPKWPNPEWN